MLPWRGGTGPAPSAPGPGEASLRLTRCCLEVCAEFRNPSMVTAKAPLVDQDVGLLSARASDGSASAAVTLLFLDPARARALEPSVASPGRWLESIAALFDAAASRLGFEGAAHAAPSPFLRPRAQMTLFPPGANAVGR